MKINIKATGIELTPAISSYVQKKISPIEKYLPAPAGLDRGSADIVAQVEVGKSTRHHKSGSVFRAEVHITGIGLDLYAVSEMPDLYAAIDIVKDEIVHNAVQSKGKRETLTRKGALMMKNMMKGLSGSTARGFSWSMERLRFKGFKSFKKRP
ncbi:MAG: ribosome-associated translation inhibitor RaiA [bacterium]|nr:ribosome-associated translation inhibitor RaiA [bacterium]